MGLLPQHKNRVTATCPNDPSLGAVQWATSTGGDITYSITKLRRTAGATKEVLSADSEIDNVTLEAYVDPAAHATFIKKLKDGSKFEGTTISVQAIDNAAVPVGQPVEFKGCQVARVGWPESDANGDEPVKLTVEWAVGS